MKQSRRGLWKCSSVLSDTFLFAFCAEDAAVLAEVWQAEQWKKNGGDEKEGPPGIRNVELIAEAEECVV